MQQKTNILCCLIVSTKTIWVEHVRTNIVGQVWSRMHPDCAELLTRASSELRKHNEELQEARTCVLKSFSKMCVRRLEGTFIRPLLARMGELEAYTNSEIATLASPTGISKLDALFEM